MTSFFCKIFLFFKKKISSKKSVSEEIYLTKGGSKIQKIFYCFISCFRAFWSCLQRSIFFCPLYLYSFLGGWQGGWQGWLTGNYESKDFGLTFCLIASQPVFILALSNAKIPILKFLLPTFFSFPDILFGIMDHKIPYKSGLCVNIQCSNFTDL